MYNMYNMYANAPIIYFFTHVSLMSCEELEEIINFLIQRTQLTTLYKVKAHANIIGNIIGNEEADTFAEEGTSKEHSNDLQSHDFAHSTLYYYRRDDWLSMGTTHDKGTIKFLEKHLTKHNKNINLKLIPILW